MPIFYLADAEVNNVDMTITRDILLPSGYMPSKQQAHNVTYVVTYGAAPSNFQASYYKRQFQQLLASSTTSYLVRYLKPHLASLTSGLIATYLTL